MTRPVRFGVGIAPQHADFRDIRSTVIKAEELGADAVFVWDHFFPLSGDPEGKHFECWTILGSWAEITERVEIGALVSAVGYRNPDLLADMARTVDHASDGRLILGIGAGWKEKDYDEYGYEFGTPGSRLADLEAALPRIKSRWEKLNPAPTRDIPILIGGGGEKKTLRYTAQYADIWHGFGKPEIIKHKNGVLDAHCAEVGRDPGDIERSSGADAKAVDTADELVAAGTTFITVGVDGRTGFDMGPIPEWVAWRDQRNAD